jgi:hypothetical protein
VIFVWVILLILGVVVAGIGRHRGLREAMWVGWVLLVAGLIVFALWLANVLDAETAEAAVRYAVGL